MEHIVSKKYQWLFIPLIAIRMEFTRYYHYQLTNDGISYQMMLSGTKTKPEQQLYHYTYWPFISSEQNVVF